MKTEEDGKKKQAKKKNEIEKQLEIIFLDTPLYRIETAFKSNMTGSEIQTSYSCI